MEREQILKVMVPVGAFGLLLVIVGVVIALNSGGSTPNSTVVNPANSTPPPQTETPGAPQSAVGRFEFSLDGPEWKDIGGGLKMWDVKEGDGAVCPSIAEKPNVWPIMHYTGWLVNGSVFDSSRPKGRPLDQYPLKDLIKGWQQGVPGMKVGGVRRLLIPSDLGYGPQNKPGIPANSTLVFEMELVNVR